MVDILRIGLTGLLAQQRALAVTSNNIANATTPGYSRQRAELSARLAERQGPVYFGTGVDLSAVRRIGDDFLADQLRAATASFGRADVFAGLAASIDSLLADERTGLNITLQNFINAVQQVADDPSSTSARQALLSEAKTLTSRFATLDNRVREISNEIGGRIAGTVSEINSLGANIAALNREIVASGGAAGGSASPALLDQRDRLLQRLSELVRVDTAPQSDGSIGVFIGTGQALVLGTASSDIAVRPGRYDPSKPEIVLKSSSGDTDITQFIAGGELGGLLDFRREMLAPIASSLGRIAVGIAESFNAVHREGMDLNDQLGTDFFSVPPPIMDGASTNTGTGTVAATISDVSALEATSYRLSYDGASYVLTRLDNGAVVPMAGAGTAANPFVAAGLSIVVGGAPAAGDEFLIQPLEHVAGSFDVLINDAAFLAVAAPIRTAASLGNAGTAKITQGEVVDVTDPNLLATSTIEFIDATTYSINGAGAFAYASGADIVVNGARVRISGAPVAGDQFVIEANFGGSGDNRNALRIIDRLGQGLFDGGITSLQSAGSNLVTNVGIQAADTANNRDAQRVLRDQIEQDLDAVAGVNLDEEAADLLRYEQMYQASAQTMATANLLFDTLLSAIRGG